MDTEYLRVSEVARILHVDPQTIYNWIKAERLPAYRIGRTIRIPAKSVSDMLTVYGSDGNL